MLTYAAAANAGIVHVATVQPPAFYAALAAVNAGRAADGVPPLLLLHGIWADDDASLANGPSPLTARLTHLVKP